MHTAARYSLRNRIDGRFLPTSTAAQLFHQTSDIASHLPVRTKRSRREITNINDTDENVNDTNKRTKTTNFRSYQNKFANEIQMDWDSFNTYSKVSTSSVIDLKKEYVSATRVKNHLLKDPLLDWLGLYYGSLGFNTTDEVKSSMSNPGKWHEKMSDSTKQIQKEYGSLNTLFEKGNKFEQKLMDILIGRYPESCITIVNHPPSVQDILNVYAKKTFEAMHEGVPIIFQAPLINEQNGSYGVADLVLRSDWVESLFPYATYDDASVAPFLDGPYHYVVIDIKWSTIPLSADRIHVQNCNLYPAYKGQLAIYTAALGQMQGYTPDRAFLLGKAWKAAKTFQGKKENYQGFNCFHSVGHIDFSGWDNKYLKMTHDGIKWVRTVRYEGHKWKLLPTPSIPELYPNMNNNQYDTPYHSVKKELAGKIDELTTLWRVEVKHREMAHEKGIMGWSDDNCTAKAMGVNGVKVAPTLNKIIQINQSQDSHVKLLPDVIKNNTNNWQEKMDIEFFVDFESMQAPFDPSARMDVLDSTSDRLNALFMIGVGYEDDNGEWCYKSFNIKPCNLAHASVVIENEKVMVEEFQSFIVETVTNHINKYDLFPELCKPRMFHWGHVEQTLLKALCNRHGNLFDTIDPRSGFIDWIDMLKVFWDEPIVVKGATRFGLKEIAGNMYKNGLITTKWPELGPGDGLEAMILAIKYFNLLEHETLVTDPIQKQQIRDDIVHGRVTYQNIILYNEIDCKSVWDIVSYLRNNHVGNAENDEDEEA